MADVERPEAGDLDLLPASKRSGYDLLEALHVLLSFWASALDESVLWAISSISSVLFTPSRSLLFDDVWLYADVLRPRVFVPMLAVPSTATYASLGLVVDLDLFLTHVPLYDLLVLDDLLAHPYLLLNHRPLLHDDLFL